jgi:Domain of unknown function (DUF3943)
MVSSRACGLGVVLACALSAACASGAAKRPTLPEGAIAHKSYILPMVEIVAMDAAVNLAGRLLVDRAGFTVTPASIRRNLRGPWVVDDDPFRINQFGHPYQGAMYHGIARSNGLSYWPSLAYTFAGSALWEIAGEATPPSRNDQIASGIAGSFLGEPLFRISRLLLERADGGPGKWRMLASMLASPPTGINHALFGSPAGSVGPEAVPFSDIRVQIGATAAARGQWPSAGSPASLQPHLALSMEYGHPGRASYRHQRPFDYFRIESSISAEGLEQLSTRGLIAGADYGGERLAGIWGLYGTYDYLAPDEFRFSSTAFTVGTTIQAAISESLLVQSSGLIGVGYAAAHALDQADWHRYHYGVAPQALANLRVIAGRRAAVDVTAREYFVGTLGGFSTSQRDLFFVGDASLAIRVYRRHALALTYQLARRSSVPSGLPDQTATRSRVGVTYTFLGSGGFGGVR